MATAAAAVLVKVGIPKISEATAAVDSEQRRGMFLGGGDKMTGGGDARTVSLTW